MDLFDNENEIIEHFQDEPTTSIMLLPPCDETENICQSIIDEDNWKLWVDTSGKNAPPPDFYSDELGLMMDVMRVDDHGFIGKKGKPINPTLARESAVTKELDELGLFTRFPNAKLHLLVDTKLPTEEDHNYRFYRDNFIRIIAAHKEKIKNYKENHPNHKIIFFVFDESSAYMQVTEKTTNPRKGQIIPGQQLHYWFLDKAFWSVLKDSEIDYLIWYTPYKLITDINHGKLDLPRAIVIKTNELPKEQYEYDENRMMSSEI